MGTTRIPPNPDARTALEKRLRRRLLVLPDVLEGEAVFGDGERSTAFFVDAKEMAYLNGENGIAIRLSRQKISEMRAELNADERVDPVTSGRDWMEVRFRAAADLDFVVDLVAMAADLYRPSDGRPPRLPPTGADLARRQRFH